MRLPPEIRDKIVSHFVYLHVDPWYWYMRDFPEPLDDVPARENKYRQLPIFNLAPDRQLLATLRLVSRDWYVTATALLGKCTWWPVKLGPDHAERERMARFPNFRFETWRIRVPSKALGDGVTKLDMTEVLGASMYRRFYTKKPDKQSFSDSYTEDYDFIEDPLPEERAKIIQPDYEALLQNIFSATKHLTSISLSFPDAECEVEWTRLPYADCYDLEAIEMFTSIFLHGLTSSTLQHLTELRLALPCTKDFQQFTSGMCKELQTRLKHLHLRIMDDTGRGGNDFIRFFDTDDALVDGVAAPDRLPLSNLQHEFPNQQYQDHLWEFVAACENLESLSVVASHYLNLDQLIARKGNLGCLRSLSLYRIWASSSSLIGLIHPKPASEGLPWLECINLSSVKLHPYGGDWCDFFQYLDSCCPNLRCARLEQLTYFCAHRLHDAGGERGEESMSAMLSVGRQDWESLIKLLRLVIGRAGGFQNYPTCWYENTMKMEEELDDMVE